MPVGRHERAQRGDVVRVHGRHALAGLAGAEARAQRRVPVVAAEQDDLRLLGPVGLQGAAQQADERVRDLARLGRLRLAS